MNIRMLASVIFAGIVIGIPITGIKDSYAAEATVANRPIQLSPALLDLLKSEMREIAGGVQMIAVSLATADWKTVQETSTKIKASYIMEKRLTPAQAEELEKALPEHFKQLDAEFHHRAEKLAAAASAHDSELATFHYSRLVESCTQCHSAYATKRFPGFSAPASQGHR
jgi:hypothetical protein